MAAAKKHAPVIGYGVRMSWDVPELVFLTSNDGRYYAGRTGFGHWTNGVTKALQAVFDTEDQARQCMAAMQRIYEEYREKLVQLEVERQQQMKNRQAEIDLAVEQIKSGQGVVS